MDRSILRPSVALGALTLVLAGCVAPGGTNPPTPADPDAVVLRVEVTGGFVPYGYLLTELPVFTLYADGRVITQGPIAEIYPGPLMPNLLIRTLSTDDVDVIVEAARAAGLDGPDASYDVTNIADAATTVFTLTIDGETHRISAYALFEDPLGDPTLDEEARAGRDRLNELQRQLGDLEALLGHPIPAEEPFAADAARLFATDQLSDAPPDLTRQVLPWPVSFDPMDGEPVGYDDAFRCLLVEGADYAEILPVLESANALTVWERDEDRYALIVRPLLPDESGCPAAVE